MKRRDFLTGAAAVAAGAISLPPLGWAQEKSKLKITGVRLVKLAPRRPPPSYTPAAGSWSTQGVEVSAPPNIYPEFRPTRSLFAAKNVPGFTVEITTDKGITGYGEGGAGGNATANPTVNPTITANGGSATGGTATNANGTARAPILALRLFSIPSAWAGVAWPRPKSLP